MDLGELKLQNFFFNSQSQLNNDLLNSKKTSSGFDDVLKKESIRDSDVDLKSKYKGLNNSTMDKYANGEINSKRQHRDSRVDVVKLKESIREGIAQKKLQNELGTNEPMKALAEKIESLGKLQEEIKSLEKAIKEELGLPEDTEALELLASLLGVNVEQLILQLTSIGTDMVPEEQLLEELTEILNSDEINTEVFIKEMEDVIQTMPEEKADIFQKVLNEVMENAKIELNQEIVPVPENVLETIAEAIKEVPTETVAAEIVVNDDSNKGLDKAVIDNTQIAVTSKEADVEMKVEVKEDASQGDSLSKEDSKPLMNAAIKVNTETPSNDFQDQINLMKSENSLITSANTQPKGVVARSVMNQVVQGAKMSINLSDQGSEILIKLNPKNLGNVQLKMAFDKGVLLAEIQVENQTVKGIVESNIDDLRNALKEEGYNIGELDVSVNKENTGQNQQGFNQQYKGSNKRESFEELEEKINLQNLVNEKAVNYLA